MSDKFLYMPGPKTAFSSLKNKGVLIPDTCRCKYKFNRQIGGTFIENHNTWTKKFYYFDLIETCSFCKEFWPPKDDIIEEMMIPEELYKQYVEKTKAIQNSLKKEAK